MNRQTRRTSSLNRRRSLPHRPPRAPAARPPTSLDAGAELSTRHAADRLGVPTSPRSGNRPRGAACEMTCCAMACTRPRSTPGLRRTGLTQDSGEPHGRDVAEGGYVKGPSPDRGHAGPGQYGVVVITISARRCLPQLDAAGPAAHCRGVQLRAGQVLRQAIRSVNSRCSPNVDEDLCGRSQQAWAPTRPKGSPAEDVSAVTCSLAGGD